MRKVASVAVALVALVAGGWDFVSSPGETCRSEVTAVVSSSRPHLVPDFRRIWAAAGRSMPRGRSSSSYSSSDEDDEEVLFKKAPSGRTSNTRQERVADDSDETTTEVSTGWARITCHAAPRPLALAHSLYHASQPVCLIMSYNTLHSPLTPARPLHRLTWPTAACATGSGCGQRSARIYGHVLKSSCCRT